MKLILREKTSVVDLIILCLQGRPSTLNKDLNLTNREVTVLEGPSNQERIAPSKVRRSTVHMVMNSHRRISCFFLLLNFQMISID